MDGSIDLGAMQRETSSEFWLIWHLRNATESVWERLPVARMKGFGITLPPISAGEKYFINDLISKMYLAVVDAELLLSVATLAQRKEADEGKHKSTLIHLLSLHKHEPTGRWAVGWQVWRSMFKMQVAEKQGCQTDIPPHTLTAAVSWAVSTYHHCGLSCIWHWFFLFVFLCCFLIFFFSSFF